MGIQIPNKIRLRWEEIATATCSQLQPLNLFLCLSLHLQIHSVEHFVCSVNSHLTMRQENERLKGIMARIESYDVVVRIMLEQFTAHSLPAARLLEQVEQ